jgi:hypothetical protein
VRFAVDHDPGLRLYRQRTGVQVERRPAQTAQLAPP